MDCNKVEIGDRVMFGPNVSLYPATHPIQPEERAKGAEFALPIKVLAFPIRVLTIIKITMMIFKQIWFFILDWKWCMDWW